MKKTLVIENIPGELGSADISELLAPIGTVSWVYLKSDESKHNQTAYIEMANEKDAAKVIMRWNGGEWQQRVLRVKFVDKNFDRIATIAGNAGVPLRPLPNNTQEQLFGARLDARDLAGMARAFKAKQEAEARGINLETPRPQRRWHIVVGIMILLSAAIYAIYSYTHAK